MRISGTLAAVFFAVGMQYTLPAFTAHSRLAECDGLTPNSPWFRELGCRAAEAQWEEASPIQRGMVIAVTKKILPFLAGNTQFVP